MTTPSGYISRSGEFYECPQDCETWQGHILLAKKLKHSEDYLLNNMLWVKLSIALYNDYIFFGRKLTPEQVSKLRELGIEPNEDDLA